MQKLYALGYGLDIVVRMIFSIIFLFLPFTAWFFTTVIDTLDYGIALRSGLTFAQYQFIDKLLDVLSRIFLVIGAFYLNMELMWLFLGLVIYRGIGDVLYSITHKERYFIFFPNIIEHFFPLALIYMSLITTLNMWIVAILLLTAICTKMTHEYFLHAKTYIDPFSLHYLKQHPEHGRKIHLTHQQPIQ